MIKKQVTGAILAPVLALKRKKGISVEAIPNSFFLFASFSFPDILGLLKPLYMNEEHAEHSNSTPSLNLQLRQMTADYLQKHPTLTLNALATRCGVPATTMRRLMQEEQRSELAPHSVLALVSYLLKEKKIEDATSCVFFYIG